MRNKIGKNDLCLCGSDKKHKKCFSMGKQNNLPILIDSWLDDDGFNLITIGGSMTPEQLKMMTEDYQDKIRNSPLWDNMVQEYGEKEVEILLKQFQVKIK